jgi:hypothetical protein
VNPARPDERAPHIGGGDGWSCFEDDDLLAGLGQLRGHEASGRAAADDHDIEGVLRGDW